MWTKGIIKKSDKVQQARFDLNDNYDGELIRKTLKKSDAELLDLISKIIKNVRICWLSNEMHDINNYIEGLGLETLSPLTKTEIDVFEKIEGFIVICEINNDYVSPKKLIKAKWDSTPLTGISMLKEMDRIAWTYDNPVAMFSIGERCNNTTFEK